jgi:CheY-like chemotaxis protein
MIPVIVVTMVDQPSIGAAFGADEHLIKPVARETLLGAVERCLGSRVRTAPGRTILVVEDDVSTPEMIVELLKAHAYEVETATDGEKARLRVAHDINLSGENGLDLIPWMCQKPAFAGIPVIAAAAHAMVTDQDRIMQAGCRACLSIPVEFCVLRRELLRWLHS